MNAVAIQAPRLPYHPAVADRFGVDQGAWRVLTDAVFPAAERPESIIMALAYCQARKLDIFKKPVQIVPIYDKKRGGMVDTVWPGIAELRTTAMRTGSFAGFEDTEYGPIIDAELSGVKVSYPEWAQCTVYRIVGGQRVPFVGPKTFWIETYATAKRDTKAPNSMWAKRPRGQLEKCAEAAALRRAFPEEIGNEYAAEEIEGQAFGVRDVTPRQGPNLAARLAAPQDGPREGFTTVNASPLGDDDIPEFDAPETQSGGAGSEAPADSDTGSAGADEFPGDKPSTGEAEAAGPDEQKEGRGPVADVLSKVDQVIADFAFKGLAELKSVQADRKFAAFVAAVRAQSPDEADRVERALADALGAFGQ